MEVIKRQELVNKEHSQLSISHQCLMLGLNRSSLYYKPRPNNEDKRIMDMIDRIMTEYPYYGSRKVTATLQKEGIRIGRDRVRRLLETMGLCAVQPKKRKCSRRIEHAIYPYLLENLVITAPNQVWCTDISYIPTRYGWVYLIAILDLYSRKILGWRLSSTMEAAPCVSLLQFTITRYGAPHILNSDQGVQFTSQAWVDVAEQNNILLSMAGKGRCFDNIHMERFWRSLKQEEVYLTEYVTLKDAKDGISAYIQQYNDKRIHQCLSYQTPSSVYTTGGLWSNETAILSNQKQLFNNEIRKS